MVGQDQCVVQTTGATIITCVAPQRNESVMETVIVSEHTSHTKLSGIGVDKNFSGNVWSEPQQHPINAAVY